MEPIRGRPPIRDIYCPPRLTLDDENEYLCNVGLIVLIRGAPSPDLPRLIATKMAVVHGGHPRDYPVSQATITPFLITCRNSHTRDVVVQRGLYTITQAQVQFTVHEWRPRFGMGYDPPTHQVWVKIVGLPLQAWKTSEITQILSRFGHPLEILPFGQEAGHYINIVALVATKHPTRIPLAYVYMEGDYFMQIEIVILSCRPWQAGHFPPPGYPPFPDNPHPQPQQTRTPAKQGHSSPSDASSSTNAPTEPTIDLSTWSPRSYNSLSVANTNPFPKPCSTWQISAKAKEITLSTTLTLASLPTTPPPHIFDLTIATEDPIHMSDTYQIYLLKRICLFTIPRPIASNLHPLFLLSAATELRTLRQAQNGSKAFMTKICYTMLAARMKSGTINDLASIGGRETDLRKSLEIPHMEYSNSFLSPQNPNIGQARNEIVVTPSDQIQIIHTAQDQTQINKSIVSPGSPPNSDPIETHILHLTQHPNPSSLTGCNDNTSDSHPLVYTPHQPSFGGTLQAIVDSPNTPPQTYTEDTSAAEDNIVQTVATHPSRQKTKPKGKQIAIRRSQRLREKERPDCSSPKISKSAKTKMANIPFQLCSHEIPLEIEVALKLLHESGLQVDQKIQDMVQEATKLDLVNTTSSDSSPTTPVHDHIPPLMLPGENFLL